MKLLPWFQYESMEALLANCPGINEDDHWGLTLAMEVPEYQLRAENDRLWLLWVQANSIWQTDSAWLRSFNFGWLTVRVLLVLLCCGVHLVWRLLFLKEGVVPYHYAANLMKNKSPMLLLLESANHPKQVVHFGLLVMCNIVPSAYKRRPLCNAVILQIVLRPVEVVTKW